MGLILNQLGQDNFATDSNQNPLASPPWTAPSTYKLEVSAGLCTGNSGGIGGEQYTGVSLGNDQYASGTIADISAYGDSAMILAIRASGNGSGAEFVWDNGYELQVYPDPEDSRSFFELLSRTSGSATFLTDGFVFSAPNNGDVWTLAAVGTTLYVLLNGTQVASLTDSTYASGFSALTAYAFEGQPYFSNFATGNASLGSTYSISGNCGDADATVAYTGTASGSVEADGSGNYSITGLANGDYKITPSSPGRVFSPASQAVTVSGANLTGVNFTDGIVALVYLGSVVEVSSPDAGKSNPFLGTFKIVSAAPGGQGVGQPGNPYLGHIKVVANPPAGYNGANPVLGEVVVIGSAPAGARDPWLGSAETD